jgi:hypothetical protein
MRSIVEATTTQEAESQGVESPLPIVHQVVRARPENGPVPGVGGRARRLGGGTAMQHR